MLRLSDVTYLVRDHDEAITFFVDALGFALREDETNAPAAGVRFREEPRHEVYGTVAVFEDLYGMPWDLIQPPAQC